MNPQIKSQWLDALRSGDYQQARGTLKLQRNGDNSAYCCLGVLCDLYVNSVGNASWLAMNSRGVPPQEVVNWADLVDDNPMTFSRHGKYRLATLNDKMGLSFPQIADIIEQSL